jgi:hypothetical protein
LNIQKQPRSFAGSYSILICADTVSAENWFRVPFHSAGSAAIQGYFFGRSISSTPPEGFMNPKGSFSRTKKTQNLGNLAYRAAVRAVSLKAFRRQSELFFYDGRLSDPDTEFQSAPS